MNRLDKFNGLNNLFESMEYFLEKPKSAKPKRFTYWRYDERRKILKNINKDSMVEKLGVDIVYEMEKEAIKSGSDNVNGFIVQYN
jgi:hypothetical protein